MAGARTTFWRAIASINTTGMPSRSEEHTSELQSHLNLVCRLLLEKKKKNKITLQREVIILRNLNKKVPNRRVLSSITIRCRILGLRKKQKLHLFTTVTSVLTVNPH